MNRTAVSEAPGKSSQQDVPAGKRSNISFSAKRLFLTLLAKIAAFVIKTITYII